MKSVLAAPLLSLFMTLAAQPSFAEFSYQCRKDGDHLAVLTIRNQDDVTWTEIKTGITTQGRFAAVDRSLYGIHKGYLLYQLNKLDEVNPNFMVDLEEVSSNFYVLAMPKEALKGVGLINVSVYLDRGGHIEEEQSFLCHNEQANEQSATQPAPKPASPSEDPCSQNSLKLAR